VYIWLLAIAECKSPTWVRYGGPRAGAAAWDQEVGDAQKVKWLDQNWPIGPEEEW
jgi:hypothetical protein